MDIKDALNTLQSDNGSCNIPIFVPSLKRNVYFKPLTIANIKSISKMLISNDDHDMFIILASVVLDLSTEDLDIDVLTEIDLIRILLELREQNNIKEQSFNIACKNKNCNHSFNYVVNYDLIIDKYKNIPDKQELEFKYNNNNLKIVFGLPSLDLIVRYKKFIQNTKNSIANNIKDFDHSELLQIEYFMVKFSNLLYIKSIKINDQIVEDFNKIKIEDRNNFIDQLPSSVFEYIKKEIIEKDLYTIQPIIDEDYICPKCKEKTKLYLDIDTFFLI